MARQTDNGLIFSGHTFMRNRRIPGAGFVDVGNVTALTLKSESETKERISKQRGSQGQALDSLVTPKPTSCTIKSDTFDRHNLALALMGKDSTLTTVVETITDTPVKITSQGQWYPVGAANVDVATLIVKTSADVDVDATAFEFNADLGMILITPGSTTVPADSTIKVSFKTIAVKGFQIDAGTISSWDMEIKVVGENRITGKTGTLHIPAVTLGADGEIDWFGDDFAESSLSGNVVKDGAKAPYSFTEIE